MSRLGTVGRSVRWYVRQLTGEAFTLAAGMLPENAILVARAMGPAALLEYELYRSAPSHVATPNKR